MIDASFGNIKMKWKASMVYSSVTKFFLVCAALFFVVGCGPSDQNITADSSGEEVYEQTCAGCHSGGLKGWLTGAPETGDKEAWKPLVAKGVDELTALSIKGFEKMPANGGCNQCSESQIRSAVEIMISRGE